MKEEILYLSNSMLRDWESLCPIAFSKRWFGTDEEKALFSLDEVQVIRFGVFFETLCIGSGVNGKTVELTPKEKNSVYYERIKNQAKLCREYLKAMDGKMVATQEYLKGSFVWLGQTIYICGNIDIRWRFSDGRGANIDLKSTGDTENTFGDYAWGKIEKMDISQMEQYSLLYFLNFGEWPESYYLVFDLSKAEKFVPIKVNISEWSIEEHKERVAKAYNEITECMMLDYWEPKNTYSNCKTCPLNQTCKYANKFPEIVQINK